MAVTNKYVLVIGADSRPMAIVPWHRAVINIITGRYYALESYDETVRSGNNSQGECSFSMQIPAVIIPLVSRVMCGVKFKPSTRNILARDDYRCQYNGCTTITKKPNGTPIFDVLTVDHIIPKSMGGQTTWKNCVAACTHCNSKKGSDTLKDSRMKLMKKPGPPRFSEFARLIVRNRVVPSEWEPFLSPSN